MNRQTAAVLKWTGILLIFANVMIWEAMYLARRWRLDVQPAPPSPTAQAFSDVVCPEAKTIHTKCASCSCTKSERERLVQELDEKQRQQRNNERRILRMETQLQSLRFAAQERAKRQLANPETIDSAVLIATPIKNAEDKIPGYFQRIQNLDYDRELVSLAFIISDSLDTSAKQLRNTIAGLDVGQQFRRITVLGRDFGFQQAPDPEAVPTPEDEAYRRSILARSRNYLLAHALHDEGWVLWLDVDIVDYPRGLLSTMMQTGADVAVPNCVLLDDQGAEKDRCDYGSWAETKESLAYQEGISPRQPLFENFGGDAAFKGIRRRLSHPGNADKQTVPLDAVSSSVLLVRADVHRDGLVFPPVLHDHQIEGEAFGKMAKAAGYQLVGLPRLVVKHGPVHVKPQPKWD